MVPDRSQNDLRHRLHRSLRTFRPWGPGWVPFETIFPCPRLPNKGHCGFGHASLLRSYVGFRPLFPILITSSRVIMIEKEILFVNY